MASARVKVPCAVYVTLEGLDDSGLVSYRDFLKLARRLAGARVEESMDTVGLRHAVFPHEAEVQWTVTNLRSRIEESVASELEEHREEIKREFQAGVVVKPFDESKAMEGVEPLHPGMVEVEGQPEDFETLRDGLVELLERQGKRHPGRDADFMLRCLEARDCGED